jgi:hypothetical protein
MASGKSIKWLAVLIVAANLVIVAIVLLGRPTKTTRPPLPNPNGYDDFLKATQLLIVPGGASNGISHEDLRAIVAQNAPAMEMVRQGLGRECRVPIEYSTNYARSHYGYLGRLKLLAIALTAEGQLAEMEGRTNDALRIYLEVVRLGHQVGRGGYMSDQLVAIACQSIGTSALQLLIKGLDARQCRAAIQELTALEEKRETFGQYMQREKDWSYHTFGLMKRIGVAIQTRSLDPFTFGSFNKTGQQIDARDKHIARQTLLAMIALASRAYELENGKPPASFADLVSAYLKTIPQDPFTGKNMIYTSGDSPR